MPADFVFLVAIGHGAKAPASLTPQEAAAALRYLIDVACDAAFDGFPQEVQVSVAPGGVMLAFADADPQRAWQVCEALVSQLQHQERTPQPIMPVCAALTCGPMRAVDVLGHATNFEGRSAIAAARILAKLQAGQVAVEQSVWAYVTRQRDLGPPEPIAGKHTGEEFRVRLHQRLRFPTAAPPSPSTDPHQEPLTTNPFTWRGGITQAEGFCNRERETETLRAYLRNDSNCQIVGSRRIGKTSLLRHMERLAATWEPAPVVAYLDLQDPRCHTLTGWLAYASRLLGFATPAADLPAFAEGVEELLHSGKRLVLCLDEFEECTVRRDTFTRDFFKTLRACGQQGMAILTASQRRLSEVTDPHDASSAFYNTFPLLLLGPFTAAEAQRFVTLARPGLAPFSSAAQQAIVGFARHHPLALQVSCFHVLLGKMYGESLVTALRHAEDDMREHLPSWGH